MTTLALLKLYDDVTARFAAEGTPISMGFGWRTRVEKLLRSPSIAWIPGDGATVGEWAPPRNPGRNPRPLGTLLELCTVQIVGRDNRAPEDERAQYEATRLLFDAWYRAIYLAAYGTFEIVSTEWVVDQELRRSGAAIRCVFTIQAMIPDAPLGSVTDASAVADVSVLDVTEEVST